MKIYGHPSAPTTQIVRLCLAEKQYKADFVLIDLPEGEQKSAENLARHPFGLTPSLVDTNGVLYEARAIMRYIDRVCEGPALTPTSPRGYGLMEQFIGVERAYFSPQIMTFYYQKLLGNDPGVDALEQARAAAGNALDVVEAALEDSPFLAGDSFSLAEVAWIPYLGIAAWTGNGDLLSARPMVSSWWERISARPAWMGVNPWP